MALLVDTSVLVDFFRGVSNDETAVLSELLAGGIAPATAPVIVQEVLQGCRYEREVDIAKEDLSLFEQLPAPDCDTHRRAARLYREFRRSGMTSSTVDTLIVTIALDQRCDLLTRDEVQRQLAEFAGVQLG